MDSKRNTASASRMRRALIILAGAAIASPAALAQRKPPLVEVWKSPTCGCCKDWIAHMQTEGFQVKVNEVASTNDARARLGMPVKYASCHTATIGGYVVEGHVPARDIRRMLNEKPAALGLAAPGMPIGSPGMDTPAYGGRKDPYDVLLVGKDGSAKIYHSYH